MYFFLWNREVEWVRERWTPAVGIVRRKTRRNERIGPLDERGVERDRVRAERENDVTVWRREMKISLY